MDVHTILTIGEYAFRRVATGWFIRLLAIVAALILYILFFLEGPVPNATLIGAQVWNAEVIRLATFALVIVMGATELPRDIETRTILILLSKPISREDVLLGKYVGLVLVAFFTVFLLGAVAQAGGTVQAWRTGASVVWQANLLQKCIFIFLQAVVLGAVVVLLSTWLGEIPIILFSSVTLVAGSFIVYIHALVQIQHLPWETRTALRGLYFLAPNFSFFRHPPKLEEIGTVRWQHPAAVALYSLIYAAILLVLAMRSFRKREVAG